jgi:hypothetical protein
MEFHQSVQKRAGETAAVINEHIATLKAGTETATTLLARSDALRELAQARDDALVNYDGAANAANVGYLTIRMMVLSLPKSAEGELNEDVQAEEDLLDLLSPVYAIQPRTTELAIQRGQKLKSVLTKINGYLAGQLPLRDPITSGGKGVEDLVTALTVQPPLEQTVENANAEVATARTGLRSAATTVDRLNKRFYAKLQSEALSNPVLAAALGQIDTGSSSSPGVLGIDSVLQGGTDGLHILVNYDAGGFESGADYTVEWMVVGVDTNFPHTVAADPSGNALGPFTVGQVVKLRTRAANTSGVATSSVRTLTMLAVP